MHAWDNPTDPEQKPPDTPEDEGEKSPFERPPFERDPEAQRAPGAEGDPDSPQPPPMHAGDAIVVDAAGVATVPVGNDNIREGRTKGVMGPAHASNGQGQGG